MLNMNYEDALKNLEEILKKCGYKKCDYESYKDLKYHFDPSAGANTNYCRNANSDIPNGFQDIEPMLLVTIAEILANALTGKLPANVLIAYGNFLQLISQIIATYNAQQQYQQSGPGRYYNPTYRNVTNPYFINPSPTSNAGGETTTEHSPPNEKERRNLDEIRVLKKEIENLKKQVELLRR